jgi:hypothetical protein
MVAYNTRIPAGIAGSVSRVEHLTAEAQMPDPAVPITAFGLPVKIGTNGRLQPITTGDVATAVYGFLIRPMPGFAYTGATTAFGPGAPPTVADHALDVMRRGYMQVVINAGTASKNSPVYVRVAAATGPKPLGGIEATADSTNTIVVVGATFMGAADASGNTEISYNI